MPKQSQEQGSLNNSSGLMITLKGNPNFNSSSYSEYGNRFDLFSH